MASLEYMKACDALGLNELPESLNTEQIAKLHYPESHKSIELKWIENKIQAAIDSGSVQISSGGIFKPETSKTMQIANVVILPDAKPSEHTLEKWIEFFNGLDCGASKAYCFYGYQTHRAILKERLSNGWPSKWDLITSSGSICEYSLIPLISSSHYEAWTDKPEPTEGGFLNGWLGISKQGNDKQQVNVDAGKGSNAGTETKNDKGRRNNQIDLICKIAKQLEYVDLMAIPEGGKAAIKIECLKITNLFTPDGFKQAWQEANRRKLISMQDKEKYL